MNKKVSIVIPAYNEEKYLFEALQSVQSQDFDLSQLEVIVVDNAYTDSTAEVYHAFFKKSSIQSMLIKEPALGPSMAKNAGAAFAQGEVLLFLDADSRMHPQTVQRVYDCYLREILLGTIRIKSDTDDSISNFFFDLIHYGKDLFHITANMGFCQNELFFAVGGFRPELKHAEDLEFFQRAKKALKKMGKYWCCIDDAPIYTSTRRMERLPLKLGYPLTLLEWGLCGLLGLQRGSYAFYR